MRVFSAGEGWTVGTSFCSAGLYGLYGHPTSLHWHMRGCHYKWHVPASHTQTTAIHSYITYVAKTSVMAFTMQRTTTASRATALRRANVAPALRHRAVVPRATSDDNKASETAPPTGAHGGSLHWGFVVVDPLPGPKESAQGSRRLSCL
jgi:hypothetical protein